MTIRNYRITITLSRDEFLNLAKLASMKRRQPRDQAAHIISKALQEISDANNCLRANIEENNEENQ